MSTHPAHNALARLEALDISEATKEVVVSWSLRHDVTGLAPRLVWAADVAEQGQVLPLKEEDLEEAFSFDVSAETARTFVAAMARCEAA